MNQVTYTVRIEPAEEGGYVAFFPALPGCHTQGETLEEVIAMAKDALMGYIESLRAHGQPDGRGVIVTLAGVTGSASFQGGPRRGAGNTDPGQLIEFVEAPAGRLCSCQGEDVPPGGDLIGWEAVEGSMPRPGWCRRR